MADDVTRLAKFSPSPADRDAILYAAGRASAPSRRPWQAAVAGLVLLQVATVAAWLASPATPRAVVEPLPPPVVMPDEARPWQPPDPSSYLALRDHIDDPRLPFTGDAFAPPGKPLTVRGTLD